MLTYKLPPKLEQEIRQFERDIHAYETQNLHAAAFTAKRVIMGIYTERSGTTYMCRIRSAAGIITPPQLAAVARCSEQYGEHRVHVTSRAELQIHGTRLQQTPEIIRHLASAGLGMKGGGGHTIRNIYTNHDSGVHPDEIFDVVPYGVALTSRMLAEPDSYHLPRKFKISFSSLATDAAFCHFQDLGFVATKNSIGQMGFKIYAGGGLGAHPRIGIVLCDFIPVTKVYQVAKAVKQVFQAYGNRRNKHRSRIRFLIHDSMGADQFRHLFQQAFDKLITNDSLDLEITPIDNEQNLRRNIDLAPTVDDNRPDYQNWCIRHVTAQRQTGLFSIRLPLDLGDLVCRDVYRLVELLQPFGDNVLRCGNDQNLHIRNIPRAYLPNVYNGLRPLHTLADKPVMYGSIVPCTGAQTCQVGINYPRPATQAIFKQLDQSNLNFDQLAPMAIRISGCPNACANHWAGDLGFFGRVRHVNGHPTPTYNVMGGARCQTGNTQLAQEAGWVHARDLPRFIEEVLFAYQAYQERNPAKATFFDFWHDGGMAFVTDLCDKRYHRIPTLEQNRQYYYDHGATEIFSLKNISSKAECSAGIYDMIEVDARAVHKYSEQFEATVDPHQQEIVLQKTMLATCRMLLVTRGADPRSDQQVYDLFEQHFIDNGLINSAHRSIVTIVRANPTTSLIAHQSQVIALGKDMLALYAQMDDTMHFPQENQPSPPKEDERKREASAAAQHLATDNASAQRVHRFKDLRGVKCPINFAQTKIQLATMASGQRLEIMLDDGEPIHNVPGSVKLEGHKVLEQEKIGDYWKVLIEKAG